MNVLIIGGSTDIGINLASYLNKLNYNVIVTYNNNIINDNNIKSIKCDVTNEQEIEKVISYVINNYGKIDILINMAAISIDGECELLSKKDFMNVLEVNLVGTFLTSKIYSKYVNDGMIINVSSTDGIDTCSSYSMFYSASKAGIINLTKSMSLGISNKVLCIAPNWIDSKTTRSMNQEYLNSELKRINQSRLIKIDEFCDSIYKIINSDNNTGTIFRMDIRDDKLWIEKV